MGLEKIGGEVLATVGLGSNPSISRKKCALGGHPSEAIRAGAGPVYPAAHPPRAGLRARMLSPNPHSSPVTWVLSLSPQFPGGRVEA